MGQNYFIVDAFHHGPFTGNPAAVLVLEAEADEAWMQAVAAELQLSASCFLWPGPSTGNGLWRLRWFSPSGEITLCGHGTLAAAHALWHSGQVVGESLTFDAGPQRFTLRCHRDPRGAEHHRASDNRITLDFPANHTAPADLDPHLGNLLPTGIVQVARSVTVPGTLLVQLAEATALYRFAPDFSILREATRDCLLLTAPSDRKDSDIVSRFFAPHAAGDEDPVTGSAHCLLAPWWQKQLGRKVLHCYQASPRGGTVKASWDGDQTVCLSGQATTRVEGHWQAPTGPITT